MVPVHATTDMQFYFVTYYFTRTEYRKRTVIVKKDEFEILVEVFIFGSPDLKTVFFTCPLLYKELEKKLLY